MALVVSLDALTTYNPYLVRTEYIIYRCYVLIDVSPNSNPQEISSHIVDSMADSLMAFPIVKLYNNNNIC